MNIQHDEHTTYTERCHWSSVGCHRCPGRCHRCPWRWHRCPWRCHRCLERCHRCLGGVGLQVAECQLRAFSAAVDTCWIFDGRCHSVGTPRPRSKTCGIECKKMYPPETIVSLCLHIAGKGLSKENLHMWSTTEQLSYNLSFGGLFFLCKGFNSLKKKTRMV